MSTKTSGKQLKVRCYHVPSFAVAVKKDSIIVGPIPREEML